jgi:hypothetical protein
MIDQELLTGLQYALVEPPDGGASWPSGLWTRDEVLSALNTRMRQFLRDTQAIVTRVEIAVSALTNPVALPADWIATLAGVWRPAVLIPGFSAPILGGIYFGQSFPGTLYASNTGARVPLPVVDAFESDLGLPTWETVGATPIGLLDGDDGTLTIRLAPVPNVDGFVELLYVALPTTATGSGVTLSIPDEVLDSIKYGVLADLLGKVGRAMDAGRAQYGQERFQLGELVTEIILGGWA